MIKALGIGFLICLCWVGVCSLDLDSSLNFSENVMALYCLFF